MNGSEYNNIRRRPMRSMRASAIPVKIKLVTATLRDASVGLLNPTSVNIVAEKYMSEFYDVSSDDSISQSTVHLRIQKAVAGLAVDRQ